MTAGRKVYAVPLLGHTVMATGMSTRRSACSRPTMRRWEGLQERDARNRQGHRHDVVEQTVVPCRRQRSQRRCLRRGIMSLDDPSARATRRSSRSPSRKDPLGFLLHALFYAVLRQNSIGVVCLEAFSETLPFSCPLKATKTGKWRQRAAQGESPKSPDIPSDDPRSGNAEQGSAKRG